MNDIFDLRDAGLSCRQIGQKLQKTTTQVVQALSGDGSPVGMNAEDIEDFVGHLRCGGSPSILQTVYKTVPTLTSAPLLTAIDKGYYPSDAEIFRIARHIEEIETRNVGADRTGNKVGGRMVGVISISRRRKRRENIYVVENDAQFERFGMTPEQAAKNLSAALIVTVQGEEIVCLITSYLRKCWNDNQRTWEIKAIIAHELGHHLAGHHTFNKRFRGLDSEISDPAQIELKKIFQSETSETPRFLNARSDFFWNMATHLLEGETIPVEEEADRYAMQLVGPEVIIALQMMAMVEPGVSLPVAMEKLNRVLKHCRGLQEDPAGYPLKAEGVTGYDLLLWTDDDLKGLHDETALPADAV